MIRFAGISVLMIAASAVAQPVELHGEEQNAADHARVEFFESKIRPALVKHCAECHSSQSDPLQGGLSLESRSAWKRGGDSGAVIVPGDPASSLLMKAIDYSDRDLQMPPETRLPQSVIDDFKKWIADGAIDPREPAAASVSKFDLAQRRASHWAWQPLKPVDSRNSIDRMIDDQIAANGLTASPPALPDVLLRRLSLTLTGLPPSPAEYITFEAQYESNREQAIATHVDRMLESPHFGEHWGRHWLDVVRFSETKGHVTDQERPFAWKYRDYVIQALNEDVPYDRFVIEHLAGDLLSDDMVRPGTAGETNVAPTGTSALFMHEMHFMAVDPVRQRWDEINAQIDVVGKAFLGLTLECARCHDHKFDAISQRDYYALAGFFYSTEQGRIRTGPRINQPLSQAATTATAEKAWKDFLNGKIQGRQQAQRPKVDSEYFPISEELGIQAPNDTARLFKLMKATATADPSWSLWTRSAVDVTGRNVPLLIRGEAHNHGDIIPRRFLEAIEGMNLPTKDELGKGSGRLWLARQIVSPGNPLTARVWVNRIWHHLFGQGIVSTPDNFGVLGGQPSHPELLDHLANQLIASGWSTKSVIRRIVTTRTFQRSSTPVDAAVLSDPQNVWLSHQNRRRMTAEQLRDSMLAISGSLDRSQFGPSIDIYVPPYATANKPSNIPVSGRVDGENRRSIYLKVRRLFYDPFLMQFDFPDRGKPAGRRLVTTVPSQALAMLNSPLVHELTSDWGNRLAERDDLRADLIKEMFLACSGRHAVKDELKHLEMLFERLENTNLDASSAAHWKDIGHVLFNQHDFLWYE